MASNIWIEGGDGVDLYISGGGSGQTVYAGSGTPWTSQSTTPYEIGLNDVTGGPWTPQSAPQELALSGGAPFTLTSRLVSSGLTHIMEEIPIQMRGTTHDNCVALLHRLRRVCNTAATVVPPFLAFQPNGATSASYFQIYAADIQEHPFFINQEDGQKLLRATLRLTRSAVGSAASLTTTLNAVSFGNVGTGSPDNLAPYTNLAGELLNSHGAPLNIKITPSGSSTFRRLYMATVADRIYTSVNTAKTTTTSTAYVTGGTAVQTGGRSRYGVKLRVVARYHTFTNLTDARFSARVKDRDGSTGTVLKTFPDQAAANTGASSGIFIDFGYFDISAYRRAIAIEPTFNFEFFLESADGSSVTATLDYFEILQYYDFCCIEEISNGLPADEYLHLEQAQNATAGGTYTPTTRATFFDRRVSDDTPIFERLLRGRAPRAREYSPGNAASLWMSWEDTSFEHEKTDTCTVTAEVLPLYMTLRGGG